MKKRAKFPKEKYSLIDISPLLSTRTAVFPGDIAFSRAESMSTQKGQHLTLSSITTTLHIGAHADAPIHYHAQGKTIEKRDLHFYYGKCQVVKVRVKNGELITQKHLPKNFRLLAPRLLFRTDSFHPEIWQNDFPAFAPELLEMLAKAGVILIGIDTPSIDPASSKSLVAHQMVYSHNLAILEGLDLRRAKPGLYTLSALPLSLEAGDASPVRAVLIANK